MKKIISMALLAAMLLSCFAGCTMQKGEIVIADEANVQDVDATVVGYTGRTEIDTTGGEYRGDGSTNADGTKNVVEGNGGNATEKAQPVNVTGSYDTYYARKGWQATISEWFAEVVITNSVVTAINKDLGKLATDDYYPEYKGKYIYEIYTAEQFVSFTRLMNYTVDLGDSAVHEDVAATGKTPTKKPVFDFSNKVIVLKRDFDFSAVAPDLTYVVSDGSSYFNGILDGEGHVVKGLKRVSNNSSSQLASLLGVLVDATVKDIAFVGCDIDDHANGKGMSGLALWSAGTLTIDNVYVGGTIDGKIGNVGGFVGIVYNGTVTISNCTNACTITSSGNCVGGILGATKKTGGTVKIENCLSTADIKGNSQTGGILGKLADGGSGKNVYVTNCAVSGNITGNTMSGGVVGYCDKKVEYLEISGCTVNGTLTMPRTSGGIMGTLNLAGGRSLIKNCTVTGTLNFTLSDNKNNNVGGLVGKVHSNVTIEGCRVDANMTVTYKPSATSSSDIISGAGGLIGRVYSNVTDGVATDALVKNSSVGGFFTFIDNGNIASMPFNAGRLVGNVGEGSKVYFDNATIDKDLVVSCSETVIFDAVDCLPILPIGYQTKDNKNGTYDMRFVFAFEDGKYDGVGVKASIRYTDASGKFFEKNQISYAEKAYKSVKDELGTEYKAADYAYDYVYTVVVKGVPSEYQFDANNLQVVLTPLGAIQGENEEITIVENTLAKKGSAPTQTAAKNYTMVKDNFSNTLDDRFTAEGAIMLAGGSYDLLLSAGVHKTQANKAECTGDYATGTATIPTHYYFDATNAGPVGLDREFHSISYKFVVTEAGTYDICIDMRMKGAGTDGNGANSREVLMVIDGKGGADAYDLSFALSSDDVKAIKTASAGSYMTGLSVYLEEGEHVLSFKLDPSYTSSLWFHLRNVYLAKAN